MYAANAPLDETVTLTLVLTNGYVVNPNSASATMKIYPPRPAGMAVAIHDSGWTKMNGLSSTNWNYFVMPESVKEALRSDGTPFVVVSDLDIANGVLTNANGSPKYPILISLAAEVIRDEEIAPLTNYVAAGRLPSGRLLLFHARHQRQRSQRLRPGQPDGAQLQRPVSANWVDEHVFRQADSTTAWSAIFRSRGLSPGGCLPLPEEISWGTCANSRCTAAPHQIWPVSASNA